MRWCGFFESLKPKRDTMYYYYYYHTVVHTKWIYRFWYKFLLRILRNVDFSLLNSHGPIKVLKWQSSTVRRFLTLIQPIREVKCKNPTHAMYCTCEKVCSYFQVEFLVGTTAHREGCTNSMLRLPCVIVRYSTSLLMHSTGKLCSWMWTTCHEGGIVAVITKGTTKVFY